jgi:hypothetical protein
MGRAEKQVFSMGFLGVGSWDALVEEHWVG